MRRHFVCLAPPAMGRAIRYRAFAAAIAMLASAMDASAYSADAVSAANLVLEVATTRQKFGAAQAWEVAAARYDVLDMKYRAKAISRPSSANRRSRS